MSSEDLEVTVRLEYFARKLSTHEKLIQAIPMSMARGPEEVQKACRDALDHRQHILILFKEALEWSLPRKSQ